MVLIYYCITYGFHTIFASCPTVAKTLLEKNILVQDPVLIIGSNTAFSCHVSFVSLFFSFFSFFHLSLLIWKSCFIFFVFHNLYINKKLSGQLIHSRFIPWFDFSDISSWLDLGYTCCQEYHREWLCPSQRTNQEALPMMLTLNILLRWCLPVVSAVSNFFSM